MLNYTMNAGRLPATDWSHGADNGSRNLSEACHIYDLFTYLADSPCRDVAVLALSPQTEYYTSRDNFVAVTRFEDGTVGTLTYTALGSSDHPKERLEVFCDGRVVVLDDYVRLSVAGGHIKPLSTRRPDKGHVAELIAFSDAIRSGDTPIPLWQQAQATEIAFEVERRLSSAFLKDEADHETD